MDRAITVAVVGLGKLGAPLAAVFAKRGFRTIGLDLNAEVVAAINAARAPVSEPGLQETIEHGRTRLRATTDYNDAICKSDASFIIVPTPSESNHYFSNRFLEDAADRIGTALRRSDRYHLAVVTSTVMPGTAEQLKKRLERASGRTAGKTLGVCYSPEFIALGSVIRNLEQPDMVLIGESDSRAGQMLAEIYAHVTQNRPAVHRMSFINAEICKLALNTFVTTKISYANMIADLCDHLSGADCDVVTRALGADSRIGPRYLRGALGYGGPCFPRDNKALSALARDLGVNSELPDATDRVNDYQVERIARVIGQNVRPPGNVAILGMSYKPDTNVIESSQSLSLARRLSGGGYRVTITDPQSAAAASAALGPCVRCAPSAGAAIADADAVVIATPWPEYAQMTWPPQARPVVIIDPWRIIQNVPAADGVTLISLGRGARCHGATQLSIT